MEISSMPQLFCAVLPGQSLTGQATPVWMAYRTGDGPRLFRTGSPEGIHGGILAADDAALHRLGDASFFCRQAVRECRARDAAGFWANWSQPVTPQRTALLNALAHALKEAELELWVPEEYAAACPEAWVLIPSALSGGTLRLRLTGALERYGPERVTLAVEGMCHDFPLPCPDGTGQQLTAQQLAQLRERHHPAIHFSEEFCCCSFTYAEEVSSHLVLFDTRDTILRKLRLAKALGVRRAMTAAAEFTLSASPAQ